MQNTTDERSLLKLTESLISAVEQRADQYHAVDGKQFAPLLNETRSLAGEVDATMRQVAARERFLPGLARLSQRVATLIDTKGAARANAKVAETCLRKLLDESGRMLVLNREMSARLIKIETKLNIDEIKTGLRNGSIDRDRLDADLDRFAGLAARVHLLQIELASSELCAALVVLETVEAELRTGDATLVELERALNAAETIVSFAQESLVAGLQ